MWLPVAALIRSSRPRIVVGDKQRLPVAPHKLKFLANFRNCFDAQQKNYRGHAAAARCRTL